MVEFTLPVLSYDIQFFPAAIARVNSLDRRQFGGSRRFQDVFTKLRVLELTEYSKVCLLDSDMLVRDNIDEIFDLQPPAALVRGTFPPRHGEASFRIWSGVVNCATGAKVPVTTFWNGHRQITGINGGCMLLEPSQEVRPTKELCIWEY